MTGKVGKALKVGMSSRCFYVKCLVVSAEISSFTSQSGV